MSYVVDAPLVLARDQEGKVHHCYKGAVIPWLPADLAAHLLELGMVRKVSASEPAEEPKGESDEASGQPLRVHRRPTGWTSPSPKVLTATRPRRSTSKN